MGRVFKGFRFGPELYEKFKGVVERSGLMVTEAFERFMKASVDAGTVRLPEAAKHRNSGVEAEARILLSWLRKKQYSYSLTEDGDEINIDARLLQMLSQVEDEALQKEIEEQLKKG